MGSACSGDGGARVADSSAATAGMTKEPQAPTVEVGGAPEWDVFLSHKLAGKPIRDAWGVSMSMWPQKDVPSCTWPDTRRWPRLV